MNAKNDDTAELLVLPGTRPANVSYYIVNKQYIIASHTKVAPKDLDKAKGERPQTDFTFYFIAAY